MKSLIGLSLTILSISAFANIKDEALKFVPGGTVVEEKAEEVKVKTPTGSVVEVEFTNDGKLEEASGKSVENDLFVPGNNLMNLKEVVAAANKSGKKPVGEWSLENSILNSWHYEFEGYENGKKMDYVFDAKSGKMLESKTDD